MLLVIPVLPLFALRLLDHGQLKAAFIKATLRGCTRAQLRAWTDVFVAQRVAAEPAQRARYLFPDALDAIAAHARDGHRLVLMSASTDLYVPAIARALGFDEVICTGVRWNGERLQGDLSTPNRRGEEKVRCFEELRRKHPGASFAYGNAGSDLPHLALADHPLLVNGSLAARREAQRVGVPCAVWK